MTVPRLKSPPAALHPVRIVSARTGLSPDVLRVWERRYCVVQPTRSEGRQRLYSDADVERLRMLANLTAGGRAISQLAPLTTERLLALVNEDGAATAGVVARGRRSTLVAGGAASTVALALGAIEQFDSQQLDQILRKAALRLGTDDMLDHVIAPILLEVGERWHRGTFVPANEHLASAVIRTTLAWMSDQSVTDPTATTAIVGTPVGQTHELGALIAGAVAVSRGWRVIYLGANLPSEDYVRAVQRTNAKAVALSIVYPAGDPALRAALKHLAAALPPTVALVLGGAAAADYARALGRRATVMERAADFREWLERSR